MELSDRAAEKTAFPDLQRYSKPITRKHFEFGGKNRPVNEFVLIADRRAVKKQLIPSAGRFVASRRRESGGTYQAALSVREQRNDIPDLTRKLGHRQIDRLIRIVLLKIPQSERPACLVVVVPVQDYPAENAVRCVLVAENESVHRTSGELDRPLPRQTALGAGVSRCREQNEQR